MINHSRFTLFSVKGGLGIAVALFILLMVKLTWFTDKAMYDVQCQASAFYLSKQPTEEIQHGDMLLHLVEQDGRLSLTYYSAFDDNVREYAVFEGELLELHTGSITYDYSMNMIDYQFSDVSQLNDYLLHELNLPSLKIGQSFPQSIQVLDADFERHFLVLKFSPSNQLWACNLLY